MSVICQNFVENAWKKDLCSNCFKSVGDHEYNEDFESSTRSENAVQNGNSHPQSHGAPHTTWKSLISEKNTKNCQPFKLETGFRGKLLTINQKANFNDGPASLPIFHGEYNCKNGNTNGCSQSQAHETHNIDIATKRKETHHFQNGGKSNSIHENEQMNGIANKTKDSPIAKKSNLNGILKNNSEGKNSTPKSLQSILKKNKSPVAIESSPSRRSGNVGFKDEEPLVIGYGGRDFSSDDVEWNMTASDIENGSDSLDESEDDKAFSNMTKQNTVFNSDKYNLLQLAKEREKKNAQMNGKVAVGKIIKSSSREREKSQEITNGTALNMSDKIKRYEKNQAVVVNSSNKCRTKINQRDKMEESRSNGNSIVIQNSSSRADKRQMKPTAINKMTAAEPEGKNEKVTLSEPLKEGALDENNFGEEAGSAQTVIKDEAVTPEDNVLFSDSAGSNSSVSKDIPWSGGNEILQAINTSLANRHKMKEDEPKDFSHETSSNDADPQVMTSSNEIDETQLENSVKVSVVDTSGIEPRASFLHGIASDKNDPRPSAIYGPASDLFVTRSDSSSSSSSEELGKSQISLSVTNVTVNNERESDKESESKTSQDEPAHSENISKPRIPIKPQKPPPSVKTAITTRYVKNPSNVKRFTINGKAAEDSKEEGIYYSVATNITDSAKSINRIDHYAESNIYHEVKDKESFELTEKDKQALPGRESKLAALAMELEQVRHGSNVANTKRQAPAPPKVPEPPSEEPPSCTVRTPSPAEQSFRGDITAFSSASSTTSSSSQDTDTGFTSWNVSDDQHHKYSKSKSSFLLTQYSRCKMLAMGYTEDSVRGKKKFSLKKLLKIGKESEFPVTLDPNSPNPKAWKYSDHFERPRAKLEIIHPMDLENKTVTVNPGFDSMHSGSISSFTSITDESSVRNSVSSDYGSYYSDATSPTQVFKPEAGYECLQNQEYNCNRRQSSVHSDSTSPTPSRCSSASQASTLTSGSSKNSGAPPHRPPKPPPPPRAHSLVPVNKFVKNTDRTVKISTIKAESVCISVNGESSQIRPQAPKRQAKVATIRYGEYDNCVELQNEIADRISPDDRGLSTSQITIRSSGAVEDVPEEHIIKENEIITENSPEPIENDSPQGIASKFDSMLTSLEKSMEDINALESSTLTSYNDETTNSTEDLSEIEPDIIPPITVEIRHSRDKVSKSSLTRNKHPPLTKSPTRQPPIYTKLQAGFAEKNNPWKTLKDTYLELSTANREILSKLTNQALRKRQNQIEKLQKNQFCWSNFEIDVREASSVFAFGDKIAYHATIPKFPEYEVTLVISIQQQQTYNLSGSNNLKYPALGQFTDSIPGDLLENSKSCKLDCMQATILVLDRSIVTTMECFIESLPDELTAEKEKELCFIILQLIHSLKSLQAQGIESMSVNFQDIILSKSENDNYFTLVSLTDSSVEELSSDYYDTKLSLCLYALTLLFHTFRIQTVEEYDRIPESKFSSASSWKLFKAAVSFLSEEKAVSLTQTKLLLECYLWGVTKIIENSKLDDIDGLLQRWLDIERSYCIKTIVNDENLFYINTQNEFYSQFLIRTSVRNIKDVSSYL